jgi:hypothetical protein
MLILGLPRANQSIRNNDSLNMTDQVNKVLIMKSDGSLQQIGTIDEQSGTINVNSINIPSVDDFNSKVFRYILGDKNHLIDTFEVIKSEDILGIVFHIMRWRRCTGYLIVQKSDNGIRYLCYMYDKIVHGAQSFGTNPELVKMDDVKNEMQDALRRLIVKINGYRDIIGVFTNFGDGVNEMLGSPDTLNQLFGI